uniref:Trithorax group protein osa n=1 Tax=Bursaphelenchus xylophilus TaxID=6326 RepID=A0A1I7S901_BURXY
MHVAATSSSSASQSPQTQLYSGAYASFGRGGVLSRNSDPKLDVPLLEQGHEDDLDSSQLAASSSLTQSPNIDHSASPFRSDTEYNLNLDSFDQCSGSSGTAGATPREEPEPTSSQALVVSVNAVQVRRLKRLAALNGSLLRKCGVSSAHVYNGSLPERILVGKSEFHPCPLMTFPPAPRARKFQFESMADLQKQSLGTPGPSGESRKVEVKYKPNEVPGNVENPMLMSMLNKNGPSMTTDPQTRYVSSQSAPMSQPYGPGMVAYKMPNGEIVHEGYAPVETAKFNGQTEFQSETAPSPKKPRKSRAKKPKEEPKPIPEPSRPVQAPPQIPQQVPADYYLAQQHGMQQQRVPPMHLAPQYRPNYPGYPQQQGVVPGGPQRVFLSSPQYPQQMWNQASPDEKHQMMQQQMRMQQMQGYPSYHYSQPGMSVEDPNRQFINGRAPPQQVISPQEMEFRRQQQVRMQMQQQQNLQAQGRMQMPPHYPQTPGPSKSEGMKQEYDMADNVDELMASIKGEDVEDFDLDSIEPSKLENSEIKTGKKETKKKSQSKSKKQSDKKELDELEKAMKRNPDEPYSSPPSVLPEAQRQMIGSAIDCVMERVMREQAQEKTSPGMIPSTSSSCSDRPQCSMQERAWNDGPDPDLPQDVPQSASSELRSGHSSSSPSTSNVRDDFSAPSSVPDYQHQESYKYGMYGEVVQNGNHTQYPVRQPQKEFPPPDAPYHGEFDKNWDFLEPNNGSQRSGKKELHDIRVEQ